MGNRGNDSTRRRIKRRLRMSEDTCFLCGLPLDDAAPAFTDWSTEIDEVIPVRKGGDPYGANTDLHLVHRCCNIHRNAKQYRESVPYPGMLRDWAIEKLSQQQKQGNISSELLF